MATLLDQLNEQQRQAAAQLEGPILIIAGAGSGKTRTLTYRVAHMIMERKIPPKNILAVTFTNKAAQEMNERVKNLLGLPQHIPPYSQYLPHIGTFHSICVRILRKEIEKIGYKKSFVIYDDQDQLAVMKRVAKELGITPDQMKPQAILGAISNAKNKLIDPQMFEEQCASYYEDLVAKAYQRYQQELQKADAVDFDDIIMLTVKIYQKYPQVLEYYQDMFRYIMVDEYQDTNHAQYMLLHLLAKKYRNLCVVGDDWQCLPAGSKVLTDKGEKKIETLTKKDKVIAAAGRGDVYPQVITNIKKHAYNGTLIRITTKSGKVLTCTPNHIVFSRLSLTAEIYYVYLMFSKEKGYRIGQVKGVRYANGRQEVAIGLNVRANQERADKMWILKVVRKREEACYWEWLLSLKYQIPTVVFHAYSCRNMQVTQKTIDSLYKEIDTRENAKQLFRDFNLFFEYPHHFPQTTIRNGIARMNLRSTLFSDKRKTMQSPWCAHRISINSSSAGLKALLEKEGFCTRKGKQQDWRLEISNLDLQKQEKLQLQIERSFPDMEVVKRALITVGKSYSYQPAAHIRETMLLGVMRKGKIVEEEVAKVEEKEYKGYVYDIDVDKVHNYIAQDIVVHNSIYGWRGADVQNILDFEKDYKDAKVVKLEQNYRSTQKILDAAYCVISKNINRKDKKLWTENQAGHLITSFEARDEKEEALFVVDEIRKLQKEMNLKLNDFAILYRTNAQSRALEEAFMKVGLPYKIIGGVKFYQRKEIKDIIAYLHFIINPADKVSFERIINEPTRGIGDKSASNLMAFPDQQGVDMLAAIRKLQDVGVVQRSPVQAKKVAILQQFVAFVEKMQLYAGKNTVADFIERVYIDSGYKTMLAKEGEEGLVRHENVQELLTVAKKFDALGPEGTASFLEEVALVSQTDQDLGVKDSVPLMTLHSAKGLEFEVIFIVGMEEGILPHSRAIMEEKEMEEERRLCYVGITRAKQKAYLLFTTTRNIYGSTQMSIRSRFMDEIDAELVEERCAQLGETDFFADGDFLEDDEYGAGDEDGYERTKTGWLRKKKKPRSKAERGFRDGDMVKHPEFGKGIIITQDDTLLTVAFPKYGLKKLAKGVAPLERV